MREAVRLIKVGRNRSRLPHALADMRNQLALSHFTSPQQSPSIVGRQPVTEDMEFFALVEGDFENLVDEIAVGREFVQRMLEEFELQVESHSFRPIEADQSGMDHDPGILTARAGAGRRS